MGLLLRNSTIKNKKQQQQNKQTNKQSPHQKTQKQTRKTPHKTSNKKTQNPWCNVSFSDSHSRSLFWCWETVHFLWSQQPTEQLTWCVWVCAVLLRFPGCRTNSLSWQKQRSLQVAPTWYHQLSCLRDLALSGSVARSSLDNIPQEYSYFLSKKLCITLQDQKREVLPADRVGSALCNAPGKKASGLQLILQRCGAHSICKDARFICYLCSCSYSVSLKDLLRPFFCWDFLIEIQKETWTDSLSPQYP